MAQMLKKIIKSLYFLIFNLDFQGILKQQSGQIPYPLWLLEGA